MARVMDLLDEFGKQAVQQKQRHGEKLIVLTRMLPTGITTTVMEQVTQPNRKP